MSGLAGVRGCAESQAAPMLQAARSLHALAIPLRAIILAMPSKARAGSGDRHSETRDSCPHARPSLFWGRSRTSESCRGTPWRMESRSCARVVKLGLGKTAKPKACPARRYESCSEEPPEGGMIASHSPSRSAWTLPLRAVSFLSKRSSPRGASAAAALAVFGAVHCGGATTGAAGGDAAGGGTTGAAGGDAATDHQTCAPASEATNHRPQPVACVATPGVSVDGGSLDQCLMDSDCADGGVCSCEGNTFGYGHQSVANSCVSANCREDSDCGPGGVCSPPVSSSCGPFYGVVGYSCHTCADQCENDSDCESDGGPAPGYCA